MLHAELDGPVSEVASSRPLVADAADSDDRILDLLRSYRVRAIPVVKGGKLEAIRTRDEFGGVMSTPVAVLMAGGRGQRLRPLTDKVPKPLLRIGGSSIIERLISSLAGAGVKDVFLAVNYKAAAFEKRLGDGGAVTVAGMQHLSHIPYGVLRTAEHHLLEIEEKPERRDFVSAGIYMLQPEVLRFVPPNTHMGMPDLIAAVLAEGLPVHVFPILEKWFDIGSPAEFEQVLHQFAVGEEE